MTEEQEPLRFEYDDAKGPDLMPWFDKVYSLPSYQQILDCGYEEVPLAEQKKKQKNTLRFRPWNLKLGDPGYYEIVTTQQGMRGNKLMRVRAKIRENFRMNAEGYLVPDPNSPGLFRAHRLINSLDEYDQLLKELLDVIERRRLVVPRPEPESAEKMVNEFIEEIMDQQSLTD